MEAFLRSESGCRAARKVFDSLFPGISARGAKVLRALDEGEDYPSAAFLQRLYTISAAELRSRRGCGPMTFRELYERILLYRRLLASSQPRE